MSTAIQERMETQAQAALPVNRSWPKRFLTSREAAAYLGVGHSTLSIHRMNGSGPAYVKWSTNVRYDVLELDRWMAEHAVTPAPKKAAPVTPSRQSTKPGKGKK
ncbi:MAG: helix-turn-helix domain-containing protein [Bryobacteraceae bacterium]|nr:helix-turn-helix domain-containing protein [Bryobacteraceae bacterium]